MKSPPTKLVTRLTERRPASGQDCDEAGWPRFYKVTAFRPASAVPFRDTADRSIPRHKACRLRGSDFVQNGTALIIAVASEQAEQDALKLDLDALVREGARRMLLTALKAEVDEYGGQHAGKRDEAGHALVVRNGVSEPRTVTTTAGELEVQAPRVNDRRDGRRFTSAILPPWARRSPKVADVLPGFSDIGLGWADRVGSPRCVRARAAPRPT
jgi:Transposase, Mutator family